MSIAETEPPPIRRGDLRVVFQPIVDLQAGHISGYEALARFGGRSGCPIRPDRAFAVARAEGRSAALDTEVVREVMALRSQLPPGCFLSLNVEPDSLGDRGLRQALLSFGRLDGVVIELTEHVPVESYADLYSHLSPLRGAGAVVALDDTGAGYAGLHHLLAIRPSILKLDRSLIENIDRDEAKVALVELLSVLAGRIDAWLLAEGVERAAEAIALRRLGVPLAQGWLFGRPGQPWPNVPAGGRRVLDSARPETGPVRTLRDLISPTPAIGDTCLAQAARLLGADDNLDVLVVLDPDRRARGFIDREGALVGVVQTALHVNLATSPVELAQKMLTRPPGECFRHVLCHDDVGRYVGTVAPERVLAELARIAAAQVSARTPEG